MQETLRQMANALGPLILVAIAAATLETIFPWRRARNRGLRWLHAAVLYLFGIALAYLVVPAGEIGAALFVENLGWGLLNRPELPFWLALSASLLLLDFSQWLVHLSMHLSPRLWRLHRVHHSDTQIDASTALRFHPAEALLRVASGAGVVAVFGIPASAIAVMAIIILVFDFWDHLNLPLPATLRPLGIVLITPELHRLHHSTQPAHHQRNFGAVLTIWDRLAGSFVAAEELTAATRFGLDGLDGGDDKLFQLLLDPLRSNTGYRRIEADETAP